jgi:hypothetical protein
MLATSANLLRFSILRLPNQAASLALSEGWGYNFEVLIASFDSDFAAPWLLSVWTCSVVVCVRSRWRIGACFRG